MIVPVILSGGSGTRLWPLSRPDQPKQLLAMVDERSMLRATFDRLDGLAGVVDPWVVCNAEHRHLVGKQLFEAGFRPENIILEPVGRNTAPAAAAAALVVAKSDPEALILILPADHVMEDEAAFQRAVSAASSQVERGKLATFGIVPSYPETGYGYIKVGAPINEVVAEVAEFVEKPDFETAQRYLASGEYLWNSGMFLFKAATYLDELERQAPEMVAEVTQAVANADTSHGISLDPEHFAASPSDSIDFAVMEKTDRAVVVPLDAGWSDVGSWSALWELAASEGEANVFIGDVAAVDVTGSYLRSESRLVTAIGLDNIVVVETPDAVMVASRDRTQDVKKMVDALRGANRNEAVATSRKIESWGTAQVIAEESTYAVKLLSIDPAGETVEIEAADHERTWTLAAGSGTVEFNGESADIATVGTVIPAGCTVRVSAAGDIPLQIVEIAQKR